MTRAGRKLARLAAGYTLIEMMVSLSLFTVIGYSLVIILKVSSHSQLTVNDVTEDDRALRGAATNLMEELRSSSDATITVATLADGNHQVRFMLPIDDAGAAAWGVYDRTLGPDAASQNKLDWSIRYTVRNVVAGGQVVDKLLVRQLLNAQQVVQRESVVAEGLRSGTDVPPGFTMVKQGEVWELTFSTTGHAGSSAGIRAVFHVRTRN